jgi:hypothetical protein
MAELNKYRDCIEHLITEHSRYQPKYGEIELQIIFDRERDHYQLVSVGWDNDERIEGALLHFDLKGDKIWIQHDGTETGIADELVAMGIPQNHIVLAFYHPSMRKHTGFAES